MSTDFETRVRSLIAKSLAVETAELKPEAVIMEDLGADSLDCIELIMAIENEFDCEIFDDDAEKVVTVSDALALVKRVVRMKQ